MRLLRIRPRATLAHADGPYVADGVVALVVLAVVYAPFVIPLDSESGPFSPWAWLFIAGTAVPLVWRRRFPLLCLVAVFVSLLCYDQVRDAASEPVAWGLLVAVYSVAWSGRRVRQLIVLLAIGGITLAVSRSLTTSVVGVLTATGGYILGLLARRQEIRLQSFARRTAELERDRELDRIHAAAAERARIARDMHDVLAHAVSLMLVQAEAGPVVARADPERAERAFDAIAAAGRDAMAQLRRMLGLLKDERDAGAREPQLTVAGLPALIERVGATSGLSVELRASGEPRPLPADAEVAAYRIVQEALTNTVKHARASRAVVCLEWTGTGLGITATDNGGHDQGGGSGGGHGLIGIRERATACGGTADAGPVADGYRVTATLPYAPGGAAAPDGAGATDGSATPAGAGR